MEQFYAGELSAEDFKALFLKAANESKYDWRTDGLLPQANFIIEAWKAKTRVVFIDDKRPEDKDDPKRFYYYEDKKIKQARDKKMAEKIDELAKDYSGATVLALVGASHAKERGPDTGIGTYLTKDHKYGDQDILSLNFTPYKVRTSDSEKDKNNYYNMLEMVLAPHYYYSTPSAFDSDDWGSKFDTWDYIIPWAV